MLKGSSSEGPEGGGRQPGKSTLINANQRVWEKIHSAEGSNLYVYVKGILLTLYPKRLTTIHFILNIHAPTAESATQGDIQLFRSSHGEASCSGTPTLGRAGDSNQHPSG